MGDLLPKNQQIIMKLNIIKILYILLILFISTGVTFAQTGKPASKISGSLLDENGKPMDYATVSLLNAQDSTVIKGTLSNETGTYNFEHINAGTYIIKATVVGYVKAATKVTVTESSSNVTVPVLKMQPGTHALNTVNVVSSKPLIEHKIDRTVMNVENSVLAAGNSAMDILERAPGVSVDKDDNISLKANRVLP